MKTFDRAMYAIFLLVLLADVARAETLTPAGTVAANTAILRSVQSSGKARIRHRISPSVDATPDFGSAGDVVMGSTPAARAARAELYSTYRAAYRRYVLTGAGASRNLFDGSTFADLTTLVPVADSRTLATNVAERSFDAPARPVLEHTISPAP